MRTLPEHLKPALAAIIQRSYDAHGIGNQPWGLDPTRDESGGCSYAAGCAIGISLKPETARRLDQVNPDDASIAYLIDTDSELRQELLGSAWPLPSSVGTVLATLQSAHDQCATGEMAHSKKRSRFRIALAELCADWDIPLQTGLA